MTENLVYAVQLKKWIIDNGYDLQAFRDLFALVSAEISGNPDFNHDLTFEVTASLKNWLAEYMQVSPEREIEECAKLMESCLLLEAPYLVDSYFQYIELDIPDPYKRFYLPRRRVLRPIRKSMTENLISCRYLSRSERASAFWLQKRSGHLLGNGKCGT